MTKPKNKPPVEPVNSAQAEALEAAVAATAAVAVAAGLSAGELEERTVAAEDRAEAAERQAAAMAQDLESLRAQVALLMRAAKSPQTRPDKALEDLAADGSVPVFDESSPHGVVVGDNEVAYVQDGHQFGRDRRYLATESNRGVGRPFNPRLVGLTKPRPGQTLADALEGFRGND